MHDPVHQSARSASWAPPVVVRWRGAVALSAVIGLAVGCASDDDADVVEPPTSAASTTEPSIEEPAEGPDDAASPTEPGQDTDRQLAAALEEVASLTDEVRSLEDDTASLTDELALARVQLEATTQRADVAEARVAAVEEIAGRFPIALDSSLIPDDMPGRYEITFQEAYCEGFPGCGTPPDPTTAELSFTEERFLRIGVDGILDAGLFALDGSLYGITDSLTALPACGDQPRRARVTVTMYADSIAVLEDGTRVVNDVNASITIDAPEAGPDCPAGLAFYATSLLPVS